MQHLLQLVVRSSGVKIRGWMNDVELAGDTEGGPYYHEVPLNEWLRPGGNTVALAVAPMEPVPVTGAELSVMVRHPDETTGRGLACFTWSAVNSEPFAPFRLAFPFTSPVPCPTRVFTQARAFEELEGADRTAALGLVARLHAAVAARDTEAALALLGYRMDELARAFMDDPAENRASITRSYERLFAADGFGVVPLSPEEITLTPVCGGQLVEVRQAGGPAIRTFDAEGPSAAIPLWLARLDEGWVVAR